MTREHGSATVQAVTIAVFLALVAAICLQATLVIGLRPRAADAADLAALAASRASVEGDEPCRVARDIAEQNGTVLTGCQMAADVATVEVRAQSRRWSIGRWSTEQKARAAPTWYLQ